MGLIFKNENSNDDMIEILTELHEKYLPLLKTTDDSGNEQVEILQKLFFGGDQLTEERARNARQGRADGDSDFERLEGFIPKVEDWHAGRVLYQVSENYYYFNVAARTVQRLGAGNIGFHWLGPAVIILTIQPCKQGC